MSTHASVWLIAGSPTEHSRSAALLEAVSHRLAGRLSVDRLNIRELHAPALLLADWKHPSVIKAIEQVARARVVNNYQYYLAERGFVARNPQVIQALFDDSVERGGAQGQPEKGG